MGMNSCLLQLRKKAAKHAKSPQQIHDELLAQRIREAWAILERLVNQNIYDDIGMTIFVLSLSMYYQKI